MSAALSPGPVLPFPSSFPPFPFPLPVYTFLFSLLHTPSRKAEKTFQATEIEILPLLLLFHLDVVAAVVTLVVVGDFFLLLLLLVCVVPVLLVVVTLSSWFIHKTDRCVLIKLIYASIDNNYTADAVPNGSVADIYMYI